MDVSNDGRDPACCAKNLCWQLGKTECTIVESSTHRRLLSRQEETAVHPQEPGSIYKYDFQRYESLERARKPIDDCFLDQPSRLPLFNNDELWKAQCYGIPELLSRSLRESFEHHLLSVPCRQFEFTSLRFITKHSPFVKTQLEGRNEW